MRVRITLLTGGMLNFSVPIAVIESYGTLNEFVDAVVKPLKDLARIEVMDFDEELECDTSELTYDILLEPWSAKGERVVLFYEYIVDMVEEGARGYIVREAGAMGRYRIRKQVQHLQTQPIDAEAMVSVRTVQAVKQERKNKHTMDKYYGDADFKKAMNERRRVSALQQRRKAKEGVTN
jgi:hypothetical protein